MLCSAKNNAHVASDVTSERCHDNSEALGAATTVGRDAWVNWISRKRTAGNEGGDAKVLRTTTIHLTTHKRRVRAKSVDQRATCGCTRKRLKLLHRRHCNVTNRDARLQPPRVTRSIAFRRRQQSSEKRSAGSPSATEHVSYVGDLDVLAVRVVATHLQHQSFLVGSQLALRHLLDQFADPARPSSSDLTNDGSFFLFRKRQDFDKQCLNNNQPLLAVKHKGRLKTGQGFDS